MGAIACFSKAGKHQVLHLTNGLIVAWRYDRWIGWNRLTCLARLAANNADSGKEAAGET